MTVSVSTSNNLEAVYYQLAALESDAKQSAKTRRRGHQSKARQLNQEHIEALKDQKGKIKQAGLIGLIGGLLASIGQVVLSFAPGIGSAVAQGLEKALGSIQQFLEQAAADDAVAAETLQAKAGAESERASDADQELEDAAGQQNRLQSELEKMIELNQRAQEASVQV